MRMSVILFAYHKSVQLCVVYFQSNSVPNHVKIVVSRANMFEDSFQEVCLSALGDDLTYIDKHSNVTPSHHLIHFARALQKNVITFSSLICYILFLK